MGPASLFQLVPGWKLLNGDIRKPERRSHHGNTHGGHHHNHNNSSKPPKPEASPGNRCLLMTKSGILVVSIITTITSTIITTFITDDERPESRGNPSKGVPCNEQSGEWRSCMLFPLKSTGSIPNLQRIKDQGPGIRIKDLVILSSCQSGSGSGSRMEKQPSIEGSYSSVAHLFLYERQSWSRGGFARR